MRTAIPAGGDAIEGYLAVPVAEVVGEPPWPGVVVVHDVFGLTRDIRHIAERFATAGFVTLAPDLYSRGGPVRCVRSVFRQLERTRGPAFDDIDAARRMLAGRPDCTGTVGVAGFCLGGGFALVAASRGFSASAPYYGDPPKDWSVLNGACPIVASYGAKDPTLKGAAAELEAELTARGVPHDVREYPKARHSFANEMPLGPLLPVAKIAGFAYHHESSEDAWRRVLSFFARHLR